MSRKVSRPLHLSKRISFSCPIATQAGNDYYVVRFDEAEIVDAFTCLSAKQLPLQLEFDHKFPKEQTQVRLYNGKEAIVLMKFTGSLPQGCRVRMNTGSVIGWKGLIGT